MFTELLSKIFIKNRENVKDGKVRSAYATLASVTGILCNVLLFIGKLTVGILSASVAIIADAFNNISDAGSSVVTFIGFKLSNKPVDKEHPLGHGRLEYVTGFIVDMLIILVGFELFTSSVGKIITPSQTNVGLVTLVLLGLAIPVKLWLYFFYKKIGNTISSAALKASAADSISDCVATGLVFISSLLSYLGVLKGVPVDGIVGILVAAFILFTGAKAAKETIDLLLGSPPDPEFIEKIYRFAENYPTIVGLHDVMVHDYGPGRTIVSFHAEVPSDCNINYAHEVVDQMERDMFAEFNCIVTVHLDPIAVNDDEVNAMREFAKSCAAAVNPDFQIHDFRMTQGETVTNLIFDLVVPPDCKMSVDEAVKAVETKIKTENPNCFAVIKGEHPFV
ncbi:MAG: cation transporter [Clostridia bacterium]|nr:cation transporter [Clostridia bacterium]